MPLYETIFIARQDISAPQVDTLTETYANIITENGGEVPKKEYWGLKSLAYRIKKNRKGHYILFNIDAPVPALREMERQMSLDENVLRYLTLRVEALEEGPSAMMQVRPGREERGGRDDRGGREDRGARRFGDDERPRRPRRDEAAAEGVEE